MKNTYTKEDAISRINGSIHNGSVIYYDDNMGEYYVGPASDLDDLIELMNSDDEDTARDAYSHWCAVTSHSDGYETEEEAIEAAKVEGGTDTEIAKIRKHLGLKRLNPRRLFIVDDGAFRWIGDRYDLDARTARILKNLPEATEEEYAEACNACENLASSCGSSDVADFFELPEDWRDGEALGPIAPM